MKLLIANFLLDSHRESEATTCKVSQSQISPRSGGNLHNLNERIINDKNLELLRLQFEREHLTKFQTTLEERLENETHAIQRLQYEIKNLMYVLNGIQKDWELFYHMINLELTGPGKILRMIRNLRTHAIQRD